MATSKKKIIGRLDKTCACCGRKIEVILYKDRSYRSGHYFGKILSKALAGRLYKYIEYWECPECYR